MSITLFHGSENIIEHPTFGKGSRYNDYGLGFYCTEDMELAKEWACQKGNVGFANKYTLEMSGLNILYLNQAPYTILNWLAVLTKHRTYWQNSSIAFEAKEYLQNHFYVEPKDFDVVIGYRANDSYFTFAQDFVSNTISLEKLERAMHIGKLGEQIVLISQKSFNQIRFMDSFEADASIYFERKLERDRTARREYRSQKSISDKNGLYMLDILREGIKNDDPRLR